MISNPLTISQLQQNITNAIQMSSGTRNVWVQAEMSDLRVSGGHCYMELLEKDSSGRNRAKIRAMIWSSSLMRIRRIFIEATGRDLCSGMKVMVHGNATNHGLYGISFVIDDIDPTYTLGDIERLRREILERLQREGVHDYNLRLEHPIAPQRIAVISAAGAAGYGDFINQLEQNSDGFKIYTVLFPAVMQGEKTAESVIRALEMVEQTIDLWDAVVIIRGGGATTDLIGFDNYDIARRVATFPLPVMVGIGHERDRTVLDEIACIRCKTPTAVAAMIIDTLRKYYADITGYVKSIAQYSREALKGENIRLSHYGQILPTYIRSTLMQSEMQLKSIAQSLPMQVKGRVSEQNLRLGEYAHRLKQSLSATMTREENTLSQMALRLTNRAATITQQEKTRLQHIDDMLRALSPDSTLRRGYSITRINGHALTDISELTPGTRIETTLAGGKIISEVVEE